MDAQPGSVTGCIVTFGDGTRCPKGAQYTVVSTDGQRIYFSCSEHAAFVQKWMNGWRPHGDRAVLPGAGE